MEIFKRPDVACRLGLLGQSFTVANILQILELSKIPCLVKMSCRFCAKYITVHSTCNTRMWSEIVPSRWYWRTYNNIVALLDVTRDWKDPASVRPSAVMLVPTMKAPERVTT